MPFNIALTTQAPCSQPTPYPFYMGLIVSNKKTCPILTFLQKKAEIENAKVPKEPLETWFRPMQPSKAQTKSVEVSCIQSLEVNHTDCMKKNEKDNVPYGGYLGLDEQKPTRYLKLKAKILQEPVPHSFKLSLEWYLTSTRKESIKPFPIQQNHNKSIQKGKSLKRHSSNISIAKSPKINLPLIQKVRETLKPVLTQTNQPKKASKFQIDSKIKRFSSKPKSDQTVIQKGGSKKTQHISLMPLTKLDHVKVSKSLLDPKHTANMVISQFPKIYDSSKLIIQKMKSQNPHSWAPRSRTCISKKNIN
ncbi:hypothetical protein G9A89_002653 [Geosiphon pyriformis]|nr:hypothetical protein G9A89_002653 [Geosiphon pyriformis]